VKRIVLISLAVFVALFAIITLTRHGSSNEENAQAESAQMSTEKEKVLKFWEYYHKATDERMDEHWAQAAEDYKQALELNPEHEDARYYLGNMYLLMSQDSAAEQCWRKLLEVNPRSTRAYLQLGNLYLRSEKKFNILEAERCYLSALKINKEETGPMLYLGEVYLVRGQMNDAVAAFDAVANSNFKSKEAYYLRGYIAWKEKDLATAKAQFAEAVKYSDPGSGGAGKVLGEGDTKGKGFGSVTSTSAFHPFITELSGIPKDDMDEKMRDSYTRLEKLLAEMKRRIP